MNDIFITATFRGMNAPRVNERDSIDFLVATPKVASDCEAAGGQPDGPKAPAPDAFSRLLARSIGS